MPWLRHFALFLVFVTALFRPAAAGAFVSAPDAGSQTRVGAFEFVTATLVGPASGVTCGLHQGIGAAYDENASGYRFAAGGRVTGARTLAATEWEAAEGAYDVIRATDDVAAIARNTGMRQSWIARAKDHLFFRTHQLDAGVARFDADPFIANAWGRLQAGTHTANDLSLLRHELFEARFEGIFRTNYRTAHDAALRAGRTWEWTP